MEELSYLTFSGPTEDKVKHHRHIPNNDRDIGKHQMSRGKKEKGRYKDERGERLDREAENDSD